MPTKTFYKLDSKKRSKIVACAIKNFAKNGYTGTSMESVAKCAGIAKGALYRYFTGKKDLYMEIINHLVDEIDQYAQEFLASRKGQNVFDTIRDWLVAIYEFQKKFSTHQKVLCNILYQENLEIKGEVLAKFGKLSTHYTRLLLQHGIARGEVSEEIDLDTAGFIIESVVDRFHDGVAMPFLDHGFGLYQQPQEIINRKASLVIEAFRRAFGKHPVGVNDFPNGSE